jgi:hypothetical protein
VITFSLYVWNNWSWVMHTMSTCFWHKTQEWQKWYQSHVNHRNVSLVRSSKRSYYNLGLCISNIEEVWSQNYASGYKSEFAEAIYLNSQNILFALKENAIHRHSKPEGPSTESIPHRFGLPTDNPRRHRQQEEAAPHLHTEDNKSKAWATTLSKTYPRWPKEHL